MGGYVVRRQLNATRRQRFSALFLAVLVILGGALQSAGTAHADEINPIVQGSVKLTDKTSAFGPTYVWNDVQISGEWRIPDQSGKEGDTFRIGLPAAFKGVNGSFELQGSGQDPLSYGTCVVSASEVVCTLNANVVGKNNVGGTFFVNTQVASTYTGNNVTLTACRMARPISDTLRRYRGTSRRSGISAVTPTTPWCGRSVFLARS